MIGFTGALDGLGRRIGAGVFLAGVLVILGAAFWAASHETTGFHTLFVGGYIWLAGSLTGLGVMLIGVIIWACSPEPEGVSQEGTEQEDPRSS